MLLDYTKNRAALWLSGSNATIPAFLSIGSGSGTALATQTELLHITDTQAQTSVTNPTTSKVKWIGDWNSVELSGTALGFFTLREFGVSLSNGSVWSRIGMPSALNFDGTSELRIEETWEII